MALAILTFIELLYDLISKAKPFLCFISLKIGGSPLDGSSSILQTSTFGKLLTLTYGILTLMPFCFQIVLDKGLSVNSTREIAKWYFRLSDIFIGQTLLGTLVCALFLSNSTGAMVTGISIHLVIGVLTILFARRTWAKAKDLADATL